MGAEWVVLLVSFLVLSDLSCWVEATGAKGHVDNQSEPSWLGSFLGLQRRDLRADKESNFWATRGKRSMSPNEMLGSLPGKRAIKPNGLFSLSGKRALKPNGLFGTIKRSLKPNGLFNSIKRTGLKPNGLFGSMKRSNGLFGDYKRSGQNENKFTLAEYLFDNFHLENIIDKINPYENIDNTEYYWNDEDNEEGEEYLKYLNKEKRENTDFWATRGKKDDADFWATRGKKEDVEFWATRGKREGEHNTNKKRQQESSKLWVVKEKKESDKKKLNISLEVVDGTDQFELQPKSAEKLIENKI